MISNRLWKILVTFKSCKTLSATAERLFVSQPSISSSMKMLEKELGVQLFDRSKNKIVLNEAGLEAAQLADTLNYAAAELGKTEELRRELMANISHDLRTPLTMIEGFAEMMRDLPSENTPENAHVR